MLQELYEQYKDTFSKSDHKLIQYLLRNEEQLQYLTSEELSAHTGISPATVSRFWKKIGFQNLKELKIKQRIQDTATPSSRLTSALKRFEETASLTEDLKMHFGNNTAKTLDRMDPATSSPCSRPFTAGTACLYLCPGCFLRTGIHFLLSRKTIGDPACSLRRWICHL